MEDTICLQSMQFEFFVSYFNVWVGLISNNQNSNEPRHEISNIVVRATSKGSDQPAHMRSLIRAFASRLNSL